MTFTMHVQMFFLLSSMFGAYLHCTVVFSYFQVSKRDAFDRYGRSGVPSSGKQNLLVLLQMTSNSLQFEVYLPLAGAKEMTDTLHKRLTVHSRFAHYYYVNILGLNP